MARSRIGQDILTFVPAVPPLVHPLLRKTFRAMAAENELQLWSPQAANAQRAAEASIADVRRIEAKYSRYLPDSVTTRINEAAGGKAVAIDAETAALLRYADHCFALSGGRFDITSGVLRRAWDFRRQPPQLPAATTLAATTRLVDWASVEWSGESIRLPRAGMEIDFGGIGKEYAADRAATICIDHGIRHGLVNLAGDVRVLGPQPDGAPWRIGITHPRSPGTTIAGLDLAAGAVATSGDYERYFELDGVRYCHILDPRSGMPVRHWQSVSVIAPLCVVAGSCSTIAMLLEAGARDFLDAQQVQWLGVAPDGTLQGNALA
jgi:thiamine biosynthesis lipoprotein